MKKSLRPSVRSLAALLILAFAFQQVSYAAPALSVSSIPVKPSIPQFPDSVALIDESLSGDKGLSLYLIQTAHTNDSAQKNISEIARVLFEKEKVSTIYVEGGMGDVSLAFLRKEATLEKRKAVAHSFLMQGELNGIEYLDLSSDLPLNLWGVEDKALYLQSIRSYAQVSKERELFKPFLERIKRAAEVVKPSVYGYELLQFDKLRQDYLENRISITEYFKKISSLASQHGISFKYYPELEKLSNLAELEKSIDFKRAQVEQLEAFESLSEADRGELMDGSGSTADKNPGDIKRLHAVIAYLAEKNDDFKSLPALARYREYVNTLRAMNSKGAVSELALLERELYRKLFRTTQEKELFKDDESARLLFKLSTLTMNPEEYQTYQNHFKAQSAAALAGRLNRLISETDQNYDKIVFWDENFNAFIGHAEKFYSLTFERDQKFVRAIQKNMEKNKLKKAALLVGGYHAPNLKQLLNREGIAYASILPQITKETNLKRYEKILLERSAAAENLNVTTGDQNEVLAFAQFAQGVQRMRGNFAGASPIRAPAFSSTALVVSAPVGARLAEGRRTSGIVKRVEYPAAEYPTLLAEGTIEGVVASLKSRSTNKYSQEQLAEAADRLETIWKRMTALAQKQYPNQLAGVEPYLRIVDGGTRTAFSDNRKTITLDVDVLKSSALIELELEEEIAHVSDNFARRGPADLERRAWVELLTDQAKILRFRSFTYEQKLEVIETLVLDSGLDSRNFAKVLLQGIPDAEVIKQIITSVSVKASENALRDSIVAERIADLESAELRPVQDTSELALKYAQQLNVYEDSLHRVFVENYDLMRRIFESDPIRLDRIIRASAKAMGVDYAQVVMGTVGRPSRTPESYLLTGEPYDAFPPKSYANEVTFLASGGFGSVSLIKQMQMRLKGTGKKLVSLIVPYDDGGHSLRMQNLFREQIEKNFSDIPNKYLPALGDYMSVLLWLLGPGFPDNAARDYKPEHVSALMDLLYIGGSKRWTNDRNNLSETVEQRIREVTRNPRLVKDPNWLLVVSNILTVARLIDRKKLLDKVERESGQNLLGFGAALQYPEDLPYAFTKVQSWLGVPDNAETIFTSLNEATLVADVWVEGKVGMPGKLEPFDLPAGREMEVAEQQYITDLELPGPIRLIRFKQLVRTSQGQPQYIDERGNEVVMSGLPETKKDQLKGRGVTENIHTAYRPTATLDRRTADASTVSYIRHAKEAIVIPWGSPFTSQLPNLLIGDVVESLAWRKDIPRVIILKPLTDLETEGLTVKQVYEVWINSIRAATGIQNIKLGEIFSHIILPKPPVSVVTTYIEELREGLAKKHDNPNDEKLNESGKEALKLATDVESIKRILENPSYRTSSLNDKLKDGTVKLSKLLPASPWTISDQDVAYLRGVQGVQVVWVSEEEYFKQWEGKINYDPNRMLDLILGPEGISKKFNFLERGYHMTPKEVLNEGAVITYLDGALLDPEASLNDSGMPAQELLAWLRMGGKVAVLGQGSFEPFGSDRGVYERLVRHIPADLRKNLIIYANGFVQKFYFDDAGQQQENFRYSEGKYIPSDDVAKILEIAQSYARSFETDYTRDLKYGRTSSIDTLYPGNSLRNTESFRDVFNKFKRVMVVPTGTIHINEQKKGVSQIRIYPVPSRAFAGPKGWRADAMDERERMTREINLELQAAGYRDYHAYLGGRSSIEIRKSGFDQNTVIRDYIEAGKSTGVHRENILYIGNEFRTGASELQVFNDTKIKIAAVNQVPSDLPIVSLRGQWRRSSLFVPGGPVAARKIFSELTRASGGRLADADDIAGDTVQPAVSQNEASGARLASTTMSKEAVNVMVREGGVAIRTFFGNLAQHIDTSGVIDNNAATNPFITDLPADKQANVWNSAKAFKVNPSAFTDEALVEKGRRALALEANDVPRIEVRGGDATGQAAQVAIIGIPGNYRGPYQESLKAKPELKDSSLKLGGFMTLEANVNQVDKALAVDYIGRHFDEILDAAGYEAGPVIDARKTGTVILADGDGTTYGKPTAMANPLLIESKAHPELIRYLSSGGVYIVISGNDIDLTRKRLMERDALRPGIRSRFIVVASGAANLAVLTPEGDLKEIDHYRENAIEELTAETGTPLDAIYLGDDEKANGNDFPAFKRIGFDRAISVSPKTQTEVPAELQANYVGKQEGGTAEVLAAVNGFISMQKGYGAADYLPPIVFTPTNIQDFLSLIRSSDEELLNRLIDLAQASSSESLQSRRDQVARITRSLTGERAGRLLSAYRADSRNEYNPANQGKMDVAIDRYLDDAREVGARLASQVLDETQIILDLMTTPQIDESDTLLLEAVSYLNQARTALKTFVDGQESTLEFADQILGNLREVSRRLYAVSNGIRYDGDVLAKLQRARAYTDRLITNVSNTKVRISFIQSTIVSPEIAGIFVRVGGAEIRTFLEALVPYADNSEASPYADIARFKNLWESVKRFRDKPEDFEDEILSSETQKKQNVVPRIELRKDRKSGEIFQVALIGFPKERAAEPSARIRSNPELSRIPGFDRYKLKTAGALSIEIGRDKSLAVDYIGRNFDAILGDIGYTAGPTINAKAHRTLILADGDGTTYGKPTDVAEPLLSDSQALPELLAYLEAGGVYGILTGNDLTTTAQRLLANDAIPAHLRNRIFLVANGGAVMAFFDADGQVNEVIDYRNHALDEYEPAKTITGLDVVYLGDDEQADGNDFPAFQKVGFDRSISVSAKSKEEVPEELRRNYLGLKEAGTALFLKAALQQAKAKPGEPLFTQQGIRKMVGGEPVGARLVAPQTGISRRALLAGALATTALPARSGDLARKMLTVPAAETRSLVDLGVDLNALTRFAVRSWDAAAASERALGTVTYSADNGLVFIRFSANDGNLNVEVNDIQRNTLYAGTLRNLSAIRQTIQSENRALDADSERNDNALARQANDHMKIERMQAAMATPMDLSSSLAGLEVDITVSAGIQDPSVLQAEVSWMLSDLALYWRQAIRQNGRLGAVPIYFNGLESGRFSAQQRAAVERAFDAFHNTPEFSGVSPRFSLGKAAASVKSGVIGVAVTTETADRLDGDPARARSAYMSFDGVAEDRLETWSTQIAQLLRVSNHMANPSFYDQNRNAIDYGKVRSDSATDSALDGLRATHNRFTEVAIGSNADLVDMYSGNARLLRQSVWKLGSIAATLNVMFKTLRQAMLAVGASA